MNACEQHTRRAALLEAVSECVHLARELQIEPDEVFDAEVDARLKVVNSVPQAATSAHPVNALCRQKRDLSTEMLQKICHRTVGLRELKIKREARVGEMLGQIHALWSELEVRDMDVSAPAVR